MLPRSYLLVVEIKEMIEHTSPTRRKEFDARDEHLDERVTQLIQIVSYQMGLNNDQAIRYRARRLHTIYHVQTFFFTAYYHDAMNMRYAVS